MLCKRCEYRDSGKTCLEVVRLGLCLKDACRLYQRVKLMFPKFKKLYEAEAKGIIPTTIWDFSEKGMSQIQKRKEKAEKWLERYGQLELT